jgi:hypothetical protein
MHGFVKLVTGEEFYESLRESFVAFLILTFFGGTPEVELLVGVDKILAVEVLDESV